MKSIGLAMLAVAGVLGFARDLTAMRAETARALFLSATDPKGAPVTDLTAADLGVKEGGQDRAIKSLIEASGPIDIALIVDDGGTGAFQAGVLEIVRTLTDKAVYSLRRMTPQPDKLLDYTNEVAPIQAALNQIGGRGKVSGGGDQLLVGILETMKELQQRNAPRRVMIVMTTQGDGQPQDQAAVLEQVGVSGIILDVVHTNGANIGLVLGDGPRLTGGRIEKVGAPTAVPGAVAKLTDALLHQYMLVYMLPDGVKPVDRVAVTTTRKGVVLMAPQRISAK